MSEEETYERYTYSYDSQYKRIAVHGWGIYKESSVLAGQPMKVFIDFFDTPEAALKKFPTATASSTWTEPKNTFDHLPDENTPEPGGMYPDDIGAPWSRRDRNDNDI
jgi:hypothetical protein